MLKFDRISNDACPRRCERAVNSGQARGPLDVPFLGATALVIGARRHGKKTAGQAPAVEQGPRGWEKGRVHASSSEANSAGPPSPWGAGAEGPRPVPGGDRHHAAWTGPIQSDC